MKFLPKTKNEKILVQDMNDEVLVYDLQTNKAFCLNQTAAVVFNACNGETTFDELKRQSKFTDEIIFLALDELKKESLLTDDTYQSPFAGMTRREVAKKVGMATMIALPVIMGVVAPQAAAAQSVCVMDLQPCIGPGLPSPVTAGNCCAGSWCGGTGSTCFACLVMGNVRCFSPPSFDCQTLAFSCCSGNVVTGPAAPAGSPPGAAPPGCSPGAHVSCICA